MRCKNALGKDGNDRKIIMYSYFVWLSMPDGDFIRLNVGSGLTPGQVSTWLEEFFKAVDARLEQLKKKERVKDASRFRIILDPAHDDPILWADSKPIGSFKLSGEFPGRSNYNPHDAVAHTPRGWPYPGN
jgi:hypothetical protein